MAKAARESMIVIQATQEALMNYKASDKAQSFEIDASHIQKIKDYILQTEETPQQIFQNLFRNSIQSYPKGFNPMNFEIPTESESDEVVTDSEIETETKTGTKLEQVIDGDIKVGKKGTQEKKKKQGKRSFGDEEEEEDNKKHFKKVREKFLH